MDPVLLRASLASSPLDRDLAEVDAAIALVGRGAAPRVRLVGLTALDQVIGSAVAHGQAVGVRVRLDRGGRGSSLTIERAS